MTDAHSHDIGATGEVAIRIRSGDIRLRGIAGTLARVRPLEGDDLRRVAVERSPGGLAIDGRSNTGLDVEVPTAAAIRLEAGSADLDVRDLHGDQHYRTTSGDIRGRGLGGDVTVDAVSGDVELVLERPARVRARSVSGDVAIRAAVLQTFRGATTSGDLRVAARFDGPGPFALETVSGDTVVAPAGALRIETSTITGEVRSEVDATVDGTRGRRTVTVGRGGPTLTFRSTSGDLRVVRAVEHHRDAEAMPTPAQPPARPEPPAPATPPAPTLSDVDPRLRVLRDLEAGVIDVAEAGRRLTAIDREEADRA